MTPDQREAEIRARVEEFQALTPGERIDLPAWRYGPVADCAFLLGLVDALRKVLAHTPTRPVPAVIVIGPGLPQAPTLPSPGDPFSDPANRA